MNIRRAAWVGVVALLVGVTGCGGRAESSLGSATGAAGSSRTLASPGTLAAATVSGSRIATLSGSARNTASRASASRPATLTGPSAGATPVVIIREISHGGVCSGFEERTQLPTLVAYSDGAVLINDGDPCGALPPVRAGWIDPSQLRMQMDEYFASADSAVDMEMLIQAGGGQIGTADGSSTELTFVDLDGRRRHVSAIWLFSGSPFEPSLRPDILHARNTLRTLVKDLTGRGGVKTAPWGIRSVKVVVTDFTPPGSTGRWPLSAKETPPSVAGGVEGACAVLAGGAAARLLKAQGKKTSASKWLVDGQIRQLAVGFVLPGIPGCPT